LLAFYPISIGSSSFGVKLSRLSQALSPLNPYAFVHEWNNFTDF